MELENFNTHIWSCEHWRDGLPRKDRETIEKDRQRSPTCDDWLKRFDYEIRIYSIHNSQCNVRRVVESDLLVGEFDPADVIPFCKNVPQCYNARRGGFFDMHDYRVRHSVIRTVTPSHTVKPARATAIMSRTGWSLRFEPKNPPGGVSCSGRTALSS